MDGDDKPIEMVEGYRGTKYLFGPKPKLEQSYSPSYTSRHGLHQDFAKDMSKNTQQQAE